MKDMVFTNEKDSGEILVEKKKKGRPKINTNINEDTMPLVKKDKQELEKIMHNYQTIFDLKMEELEEKLGKLIIEHDRFATILDKLSSRLIDLSSESWSSLGVRSKIEILTGENRRIENHLNVLNKKMGFLESEFMRNTKVSKVLPHDKLKKLFKESALSVQDLQRELARLFHKKFDVKEINDIIMNKDSNQEYRIWIGKILREYKYANSYTDIMERLG